MSFNFLGKNIEINKTIIIIGLLVVLMICGVLYVVLTGNNGKIIIEKNDEKSKNEMIKTTGGEMEKSKGVNKDGKENTQLASADDAIDVYVVGAVKKPGIVKLKKGQMISDAINASGGASEDADVDNINMVYKLNENVMLKVKTKSENNTVAASTEQDGAKSGVEITKDSGKAVPKTNNVAVNSGNSVAGGKININTATVAELDSLPGVGLSTAQKIISHREKNGSFKAIKDIMNVSGIGQSKFDSIKDLITVD